MAEIKEYSQLIEEGNKKNFDSQEARKVVDNVKNELNSLKEIVAKNPWKKWWETNSLENALKLIGPENWFYKIEANNKVTFNLDKVSSYLSVIYNRILKPGWPKKYINQKNEKVFNWTILAVQIALEAINSKDSSNKKYDVWVINWQLNQQTISALKKFQKDFLWVNEMDWKPWKKTLWKLLWVLNAQLLQKWETPAIEKKIDSKKQSEYKNKSGQQKKQPEQQKKADQLTWKIEKIGWKTEIVRDGKISYYVVQPWDTTKIIRDRLSHIQEFSYLNEKQYAPGAWGRSYLGFNIRNNSLKPGNKIPIPIETEKRQIEDKEFFNKSKTAIDKMLNSWNPNYAEKIRKLVNSAWKDSLALVMTAFAKKETTNTPTLPIWTGQLYRYETTNRYSISYFHILMEWVWKKARDNLWFKDADCYDPVKSWMLFLAFWCECKPNLDNYLNPNKSWWAYRAASVYNYNVRNTYSKSLQNHFNYAKKKVS